ncbi:hypothetical protein EDB83DRAFT_2520449 [Lactarius deliciosus]|nr:hypothetical protein EDB83DRAFT_2520449 [Lactarius deliciosus]
MPRYASSFLRLGSSFQPGTTPPSPRVDPARTRDPQLTTEDGTTVTTTGHPDEPGMGSGAELWEWMGNGAAVQTSIDALHTTSHADAFLPTDDVPRLPAPARDAYTLRLCHATLPVGRDLRRRVTDWPSGMIWPGECAQACHWQQRHEDNPNGNDNKDDHNGDSEDDHDVDNSGDDP